MEPAPFAHVLRLTDTTGIFEHASGTVRRLECGYCLDDVARALVVACREQPSTPATDRLIGLYFRFVVRAQAPDGRCHNRLGSDGRWEDPAGTGDWWGRALWALGTAAVRGTPSWLRATAVPRFERSATQRGSLHSMAFASLGAAEMLSAYPGHQPSLDLLAATVAMIGRPAFDTPWPWPEQRLRYANAAIPEAMIAAGVGLGDPDVLDDGLRLLEWLLDIETHDDHLSVTPAGGWAPPARPLRGALIPRQRPAFDQQPIEVAALADACARALDVTGDSRWAVGLDRAVGWFRGDNDNGLSMVDPVSGGGYDALTPGGVNTNEGAESTLAMVSTLQHARRMALVAP